MNISQSEKKVYAFHAVFRVDVNDVKSFQNPTETSSFDHLLDPYRRVAEIQIFEKTYLIVIKDETGLKFKMNDSTLFLIWSYAQKLVASY